jgi:hypothetical protein
MHEEVAGAQTIAPGWPISQDHLADFSVDKHTPSSSRLLNSASFGSTLFRDEEDVQANQIRPA